MSKHYTAKVEVFDKNGKDIVIEKVHANDWGALRTEVDRVLANQNSYDDVHLYPPYSS